MWCHWNPWMQSTLCDAFICQSWLIMYYLFVVMAIRLIFTLLCDQCICIKICIVIDLMVKSSVSYCICKDLYLYRSVGVVNLYENCLIDMVLDHLHYYFYYSVYFVAIFCLEIHLNLQIYSVFIRILPCIL